MAGTGFTVIGVCFAVTTCALVVCGLFLSLGWRMLCSFGFVFYWCKRTLAMNNRLYQMLTGLCV